RALKGSNIAPFFTAGSQMLKNGVLMYLNKTPMPTEDLPLGTRAAYRIAQQLSAGPVGIIAMWIAVYLLYRGMFPWEDEKSRFLQIPLNESDRNSAPAQAIWGDDSGKDAYVGLGFFSPLTERGARSIGLSGSYNTAMMGGSGRQMFEGGLKDVMNS